jgi:acylphosphatase
MSKHVIIRIHGKVQGVFFRASARNQAIELGIKGFARNEPDGDVYIEAEGTEEALSRFVTWCKKGPPRAQVMTVVIEEGPEKSYVGFDILR